MKIGIAVAFVVCAVSMIGCQEQPAAPTQRAAHVTTKPTTTKPAATKPAATTKSATTRRTARNAATKDAATKPVAEKAAATKPVAEKAVVDKDGWTLAYTADFSDSKSSANWAAFQGNCVVKNGSLVVSTERSDAIALLLKPGFAAPSVRLEMTASLAKAGDISDLSVLINANKSDPYAGYTLQFGGKANTMNGLTRKDEAVQSTVTNKPLVVAGQKYTIVAENDKGHIKMIIDGKTVIDYVDPAPICGADNGLVGLYTWESSLVVEKLSVFQKDDKK